MRWPGGPSRRVPASGSPRPALPVYVLGHEELQAAASESLGPARLEQYRQRLHAWAERLPPARLASRDTGIPSPRLLPAAAGCR